jgi:hypothetical protein
MSSVVIAGDTSGTVTLAAPAVSGTTTLTLPATSGIVVVTATGVAGFPSGTRMSFQQTAAPTGWTKDTTAAINESALRFVTGTVGTGGSVNFTTAFASQTPAGSVAVTAVSGTAGATTLTTPQIPSHTHTFGGGTGPYTPIGTPATNVGGTNQGSTTSSTTWTTASTGGGGSHDHPFSFTSGTGTFTGSAINLAVKYYDFIIATAD